MAKKKAKKRATKRASLKKDPTEKKKTGRPRGGLYKEERRKKGEMSEPVKQEVTQQGRQPFKPTDEQRYRVRMLVAFGMNVDDIALLIINPETGNSISKSTLYKHFRKEMEDGHPMMVEKVATCLFKKATGKSKDALKAQMFFLERRGGKPWHKQDKVEHSLSDDTSGVLVVPAKLDPQEWVEQHKDDDKQRPDDAD